MEQLVPTPRLSPPYTAVGTREGCIYEGNRRGSTWCYAKIPNFEKAQTTKIEKSQTRKREEFEETALSLGCAPFPMNQLEEQNKMFSALDKKKGVLLGKPGQEWKFESCLQIVDLTKEENSLWLILSVEDTKSYIKRFLEEKMWIRVYAATQKYWFILYNGTDCVRRYAAHAQCFVEHFQKKEQKFRAHGKDETRFILHISWVVDCQYGKLCRNGIEFAVCSCRSSPIDLVLRPVHSFAVAPPQ